MSGISSNPKDPRNRRSVQDGDGYEWPLYRNPKTGMVSLVTSSKSPFATDPIAGLFVRAGNGLAVVQGSPYSIQLMFGKGFSIEDGHLELMLASSIKLINGHLAARPTAADVSETGGDGDVQSALDRIQTNKLSVAQVSVTPTADLVPRADGAGKLAAGWVSEVLALIDLSDVTAKTGTGTTVVMDTDATLNTPTLIKPRITGSGFENANHTHASVATGGVLALPSMSLPDLVDVSGTTGMNDMVVLSMHPTIDQPTLLNPVVAATEWTFAQHAHTSAATGGTIALADLSDVTAVSGSGTTVVLNNSPVLVGASLDLPSIGFDQWNNAQHTHAAAASGGQMDHYGSMVYASLLDDDHPGYNSASTYMAHAGGSGLVVMHYANCGTNVTHNAGAIVANTLYAMPFVAPRRSGVLDQIGINVTIGVAGNARMGIYENLTESNIYPGARVLDAGTFTTTVAAVKLLTANVTLNPGGLYWLVLVSDVAPTIRTLTITQVSHLLGTSIAFGTVSNCGLSVAFTYAALPADFPASAAFFTGAPIPAIGYTFSG